MSKDVLLLVAVGLIAVGSFLSGLVIAQLSDNGRRNGRRNGKGRHTK